eukprot:3955088-Amphidinium_carterae.1
MKERVTEEEQQPTEELPGSADQMETGELSGEHNKRRERNEGDERPTKEARGETTPRHRIVGKRPLTEEERSEEGGGKYRAIAFLEDDGSIVMALAPEEQEEAEGIPVDTESVSVETANEAVLQTKASELGVS